MEALEGKVALTFGELGEALGVTRKTAWQWFRRLPDHIRSRCIVLRDVESGQKYIRRLD
jgi:hypothetical protein